MRSNCMCILFPAFVILHVLYVHALGELPSVLRATFAPYVQYMCTVKPL